jgi:hypothetical protein
MPQSTTPETTIVVLGNTSEPALGALDALGPDVNIVKGRKADECAAALPEARVLFNWSGSRDEVFRRKKKQLYNRTFFPRKHVNQGLTSKTAKLYISKPILHG